MLFKRKICLFVLKIIFKKFFPIVECRFFFLPVFDIPRCLSILLWKSICVFSSLVVLCMNNAAFGDNIPLSEHMHAFVLSLFLGVELLVYV